MKKIHEKNYKRTSFQVRCVFLLCTLLLVSPALQAIVWTFYPQFSAVVIYEHDDINLSYNIVPLMHPEPLGSRSTPMLQFFPNASFLFAIPLMTPLSAIAPQEILFDNLTIQLENFNDAHPQKTSKLTKKLLDLMRYGMTHVLQSFPELAKVGVNAAAVGFYFLTSGLTNEEKWEVINISDTIKQHPWLVPSISTFDIVLLRINEFPHAAVIHFLGNNFIVIIQDQISFIDYEEFSRLIYEYKPWFGYNFIDRQKTVTSDSSDSEGKIVSPASSCFLSPPAYSKPKSSNHLTLSAESFSISMGFIHLFRQLGISPYDFSREQIMAAELARWTPEEREKPAPDCSYIK